MYETVWQSPYTAELFWQFLKGQIAVKGTLQMPITQTTAVMILKVYCFFLKYFMPKCQWVKLLGCVSTPMTWYLAFEYFRYSFSFF